MSELSRRKKYCNGSAKTCRNCAKAKIRCVRHKESGGCDRCDRLGKICQYAGDRSRFVETSRGNSKDRRIDALEAKVNQLLSQSGTRGLRDGTMTDGSPASAVAIAPAACADVIDRGLLTMDAANVNAETLRREKPFLFLAIVTSALYENTPLQRKFEMEVKKAISECMIGGGQISFGVLQGLLVLIAWCQYHSRPRRYAQYLHLAISIISDLQLDRAPEHRFWTTRVSFDGDDDKDTVFWGREEQRAVIGCFYFSSAISIRQIPSSHRTTSAHFEQDRCLFGLELSYSFNSHKADLCRALDISNILRRCILRIQALVTADMDASGDRDVFYHYEKRLKRAQWWFENKALSGLNNDHGKSGAQLTEGIDLSTMAANQHLDAPQPSMYLFDT
ncbi:hypothetical protein N7507_007310 [Penicillium longicatenatum]|nr:hypothetical protein N7507_007310 [Penicillium longicatenatum]